MQPATGSNGRSPSLGQSLLIQKEPVVVSSTTSLLSSTLGGGTSSRSASSSAVDGAPAAASNASSAGGIGAALGGLSAALRVQPAAPQSRSASGAPAAPQMDGTLTSGGIGAGAMSGIASVLAPAPASHTGAPGLRVGSGGAAHVAGMGSGAFGPGSGSFRPSSSFSAQAAAVGLPAFTAAQVVAAILNHYHATCGSMGLPLGRDPGRYELRPADEEGWEGEVRAHAVQCAILANMLYLSHLLLSHDAVALACCLFYSAAHSLSLSLLLPAGGR